MNRRELLILRHAKSSWNEPDIDDYERPLSVRGKKEAPRIGLWMKQQGLIPDHIVSSPAARAKATTLAVCKALACDSGKIEWNEAVYGAEVETLMAIVRDLPEACRRPLLVGHNPGLEDLVLTLVDYETRLAPPTGFLKTATLAVLELECVWKEVAPHRARLISLTQAKGLAPVD